jgi:hypothetical protein
VRCATLVFDVEPRLGSDAENGTGALACRPRVRSATLGFDVAPLQGVQRATAQQQGDEIFRPLPMKPIDFATAAAVAVAVLAANFLIVILAVMGYSILIEPGHPRAFYDAAAPRIASWCVHTAGAALFLGAGYLFARRRPQRNGFLFAAAFSVVYAIIDGASVRFVGIFKVEFALSMLGNLLAALAGAWLATRKRSETD